MEVYTWDETGFKNAYNKYYYTVSRAPENAVAMATLRSCGRARCICAYVDELLTYSRTFFESDPVFKMRAQNIVDTLNIPMGSTIFVAGAAFGFLMEELSKLGMNVIGCDNSHYIQTKKNKESKFPIRDIDITDNNFKTLVKRFTKIEYYDYVITEDVMSSYNEIGGTYTKIFNNLESILDPELPKTNIIHIVDTNCGEPLIKKSLGEWKTINPNHTWFDGYGNI